jgi:hypothetical protein
LSFAAAFAVARGANADETSSLLKRPVSPGSIALLAAHTSEAGVSDRLKLSLTNANPEVRGVAARIINLGGLKGLLPDVALFDPDSVVCSEGSTLTSVSPTASRDVMRVRAAVVAPRLIKKTEVIYPVTSRKNREKGVSIYEAVISPTGCIRDLRLLWSSFPLLDISGIEGISHWKYAPATLHGQPVSVYLTVTVTFNLH